jgi:predicted Zn-dependent protease
VLQQTDKDILRTVPIRSHILSTACLFTVALFADGAARAQQVCSVTPTLRIPAVAHIFSVQQERTLGDIEAEWLETNYHAVHDEVLSAHLNAVAGRILSQFPHDQARIRIILIDAPKAQAFSVGPERIYITRTMITLLKNDDELAGLLGHELGHVLTHQNAIVVSQLFREILGVNTVGDRKDISDKLTRTFNSIDRDTRMLRKAAIIIERQGATHEYDADRFAVYASAAAGFSPQAVVDLFDRSAETHGSTGNLLGDFLGATTSDEKRLREINKTLRALLRPCREIAPATSTEFGTWRAAVISHTDLAMPLVDPARQETER